MTPWADKAWSEDVASHPTLRLYAKLHPAPTFARYLDVDDDPEATALRGQLRMNVYPLASIIAHRGHRKAEAAQRACPVCHPRRRQPLEGAKCLLCGGGVEDVHHVLLACPALRPEQRSLRTAAVQACESAAVKECLDTARRNGQEALDEAVLMLVLGGDPTGHGEGGAFMSPAPKTSRAAPAADRVRALRATNAPLRRIESKRRRLLNSRPSLPRTWTVYAQYAAQDR